MLFEILMDCLLGFAILYVGHIGVEIYAANAAIPLTTEEIMDLSKSLAAIAVVLTAIFAEVWEKGVSVYFTRKRRSNDYEEEEEEDDGEDEE